MRNLRISHQPKNGRIPSAPATQRLMHLGELFSGQLLRFDLQSGRSAFLPYRTLSRSVMCDCCDRTCGIAVVDDRSVNQLRREPRRRNAGEHNTVAGQPCRGGGSFTIRVRYGQRGGIGGD